MSLKSVWRSVKHASGASNVYRKQRLALIEAINHFCTEKNACVAINNGAKATVLQNFIREDDLGDRISCEIEAVKFLNFRCFIFGSAHALGQGSLVERLVRFKSSYGIPYEEASKEAANYFQRLSRELCEGITVPQYKAQPIIYTFSPFQIYEKLESSFLSLERYQEINPPDAFTAFTLEQEYHRNFNLKNYLSSGIRKEIKDRITNEELEMIWTASGSPDA
jgi:hypothetical protein